MTNFLNGYFVLGGPSTDLIPLPNFFNHYHGNHIGARSRGSWVIDTNFISHTINLPSRDKQVQVLVSEKRFEALFVELLSSIDSNYVNQNYRTKLTNIQTELDSEFIGIVNNNNIDSHGSMGIVTNTNPFYMTGLHDTRFGSSYVLWSTDENFVHKILQSDPLRYLIYRFPTLVNSSLFFQSEAVCSKWYRWLKTHDSVLHAFNALERRLFGD